MQQCFIADDRIECVHGAAATAAAACLYTIQRHQQHQCHLDRPPALFSLCCLPSVSISHVNPYWPTGEQVASPRLVSSRQSSWPVLSQMTSNDQWAMMWHASGDTGYRSHFDLTSSLWLQPTDSSDVGLSCIWYCLMHAGCMHNDNVLYSPHTVQWNNLTSTIEKCLICRVMGSWPTNMWPTSSLGDRSFAVAGSRAWNKLPPPLRCVHSVAAFKV